MSKENIAPCSQKPHDWKVIYVKTYKKPFIMSHMLKPLCILHFGFLYDTIPWALEKSKNETTAAREVVVKLNLSFLTAILIWRCNFFIYKLNYFPKDSVLLHFSKFRSLVFDLPCFLWTKIYTNRPNQTTDLY